MLKWLEEDNDRIKLALQRYVIVDAYRNSQPLHYHVILNFIIGWAAKYIMENEALIS